MIWVAFDRAVRAVEEDGLPGPVEHWRELRDQVNAALDGVPNKKEVRVSAPGASKVVQQLADLRWQTEHLPPSVTVGGGLLGPLHLTWPSGHHRFETQPLPNCLRAVATGGSRTCWIS